ncbi:putative methyltransferase [Calothrix sp. NIES-4071]|nr:putative methyltransferase [Calothrix sp. NIES-4071]BAZ63978.1 putative methyltransferase [Calothrix sp. NIES-4105]
MKTPYKYVPFITPYYRQARKIYRNLMYAGKGVYCPICNTESRSWLNQEDAGTCPHCESGARHRLLWLFQEKHSQILSQKTKYLHFAPEKCLENKLRSLPNLEYITADLSAPGVDVHTDITNLAFEDNSFDALACCHVLEHIPNDSLAMNELFRVLRPQGTAYIQVPYKKYEPTDEDLTITDPNVRAKRFGQFDHVRVYGFDIKERLESVGFVVSEKYYAQEIDPNLWKRYGLWDDVIFCCTKVQ